MGLLDKFFFNSLPEVFKLQDSNKDIDDKGTLERMLEAYQEETETYVDDINGYVALVDPLQTDSPYLEYIAGMFNYPPYPFDYEEWYRKVLDSIISINKWKGTLEGVRRWFALWGCTAEITITLIPSLKYNSGIKYNQVDLYYRSSCNLCVYWDINIVDTGNNIPELAVGPYSTNIKYAIQSILDYLIPINLILQSFSYNSIETDIDLGTKNLIRIKGAGDDKLLASESMAVLMTKEDDHLTIKE